MPESNNLYFSYYIVGQTMESEFQLRFAKSVVRGSTDPILPTKDELTFKFIATLFDDTDVNEIDEFLDYHYNKYTGIKQNWLRFAESRINDALTNYDTNQRIPHPCDKYVLEWFNKKSKEPFVTKKKSDKSYSQKQIAIAYYIMGVTLNETNVIGVLEKHSKTKSMKILQKLVTKNSQLTSLLDSKTANTKHLIDLKEVKRLLSGIKNKKAINDIDRIIAAFETSYKSKY